MVKSTKENIDGSGERTSGKGVEGEGGSRKRRVSVGRRK